ncbi:sensor histidine kinase [Streptomyces sp. SP18BB07]|uniref:sensor histidine kinase n=1 Tax=Streptomyces sp. SP18BB07 TaxID=3002522 RepID=UPI002E75DF62|nr:sensor histidine kinase [Streptomyces sp. SP18BB07]MEE1758090.1 sensor histidine kinase [Streptomyces sp. SP18BB07]
MTTAPPNPPPSTTPLGSAPGPGPHTVRRAADAALVPALFACSFPGSLLTLPGQGPGAPWWPGMLLAAASCLALLGRHTRPRTTVAVTLVCAIAACALGYLLTALLLAPTMVALYSLAMRTNRGTANSFTLSGVVALVVTGLVSGPDGEPLVLKLLGPTAWLLLPTSLGTVTRLRGAYLEAVRARAEHAERTRDEEARRRVTEERMRIARDLHDVVAHHLVLANLQATAVGRFVRTRPDEAERLLAELSGTTTSAVRELKATVGLLRAEGEEDKVPDPTPGLARLPELAASFAHAGLKVTVTGEGEPRPLPAGADLTAYRIVQEALTNVTKHAPTRTADVHLAYTSKRLRLTISNDSDSSGSDSSSGSGSGSGDTPRGGYGLLGMRERAHSVGGRLSVGPRPDGGFEVVADLPLPDPHKI